jgi:uncharacterized delta-60 repeat protein
VHSGDFDQTFGNGGKVVVDVFGPDSAQTVLVQADGKILVAGQSGVRGQVDPPMSTHVSVIRLNVDGSLDTTFGDNGKVMLESHGWSGHAAAVPMVLMSDGKVLVGGTGLHRLNSDGSLDATFGANGSTTQTAYLYSMAVMGDGRVVASNGMNLSRFNSDGTLDTTFGSNGALNLSATGAQRVRPLDMVVQSDGKLLVLAGVRMMGATADSMMVMRFDVDGTLDPSFGNGGQQLLSVAGQGVAIRMLNNGKFLVAGNSDGGTLLMRFKRNGQLDNSFANHGVMLDHNSTDNVFGMTVQSDGKMLVAGNGEGAVSLYRYNADGTRDASFGDNGHFETHLQSNAQWTESATGVALQSDGAIVLLGQLQLDAFTIEDEAAVFAASDFVVMRLSGDSSPLTVTDLGEDETMPSPEPEPEPHPAPAPSGSDDHHELAPTPVTPVAPHDGSNDDGHETVMHYVSLRQESPFHDDLASVHRSIGFELLSAHADDRMLHDLV